MAIKLFIQAQDIANGGYKPLGVNAEMLAPIGNRQHFVHRNKSFGENWVVSEYESGAKVGWGYSIDSAITRAESNIHSVGEERYKAMCEERIADYGTANAGPAPSPSNKSYDVIESELLALDPLEVDEEEEEEY
jgi:hypothetical protein